MVTRDFTARDGSATTSWTNWILSGLLIAFLVFDAVPKIFRVGFSVDGTVELGYPDSIVTWLGIVLLVSTALYAHPRTAIIGAILLTGYLGGAIATQARLEEWTLMILPAVMAILIWVGLAMRQPRIGRLLRS